MRAIVLILALLFGLAAPAFADDVATAQSVIQAHEQTILRSGCGTRVSG